MRSLIAVTLAQINMQPAKGPCKDYCQSRVKQNSMLDCRFSSHAPAAPYRQGIIRVPVRVLRHLAEPSTDSYRRGAYCKIGVPGV